MSLPTATPAEPISPPAEDLDALDYRSVHTFGVLGLLVGLLSVAMLFAAGSTIEAALLMAPVPIVGLIVSLKALRDIAAAPELYTGRPLALVGAVLSAFFLVSGLGYAGYVYATEVPDGYERLSFIEMKPSEADRLAGQVSPDDVEAAIQAQTPIFIKGYIRPSSITVKKNLKSFLLVRDSNECCFGDISKVMYYDQIEVNLVGKTTDYDDGLYRVGGTLSRGPGNPEVGTPITYYLEADYIKP